MHEVNMDKKQKTEDDKEIIDFMELVEENLSSVGNETIGVEKIIENDLFENKPLQPNEDCKEEKEFCQERLEVITSEVLRDLREAVEENSKEEEIPDNDRSYIEGDLNEELISLNTRIERMAMESTPKEKKKVIRFKNDTSLILHKGGQLELKVSTPDFRIKKYPGFLYIDIYSIEKYISSDTEVQSVFVKLETKDFVYETEDHQEDSTIKLNSLLHIKLDNSDKFTIKFILNKRTDKGVIKSSECHVTIDRDFLDKVHNTLYEINYEWSPYSSSNIFKSFISFFSSEVADAWGLKLFFSFVSEEELKSLNFLPSTLYDLGKFLKIRKYAYNTWFTGFCNIRGFNTNICTHLWKRRFIKIQGYKVFIYNEHTKNLLGIFDLLTTMSKERDIFEEDNKFRIINNERMIEFHLESSEKYLQFKRVMEALL